MNFFVHTGAATRRRLDREFRRDLKMCFPDSFRLLGLKTLRLFAKDHLHGPVGKPRGACS